MTTMQKVACATMYAEEAESDAERVEDGVERRVQRHAGDDARQRDRQDDEERDRLAPEEPVALHGERGERPEHEGDHHRPCSDLE